MTSSTSRPRPSAERTARLNKVAMLKKRTLPPARAAKIDAVSVSGALQQLITRSKAGARWAPSAWRKSKGDWASAAKALLAKPRPTAFSKDVSETSENQISAAVPKAAAAARAPE